jgi:hypothetical protein
VKLKQAKRAPYSLVLIICLLVGLVAGLVLVQQRNQVESAQNQIENIIDYDAVLRAAAFEKYPSAEAFDKLKAAHVTALAIYDRTLEKAMDAGEVKVYRDTDFNGNLALLNGPAKPGALYLGPVPLKEGYYQEIKEDLIHRLGADKVIEKYSNQGPVIELTGAPYDSFMKMNLGISRLQGQEVANRGFNVILRPTNYRGVSKDDLSYFFNRVDGIPRVTGVVFVGKEALGYPSLLNESLTNFNDRHIPVIGIEATNQLQYEPQAGFNEMAFAQGYSIGRLYTISKDEMKKLSVSEVSQRFYISDMERNIRFNLFPMFEAGKDNQTALATTLKAIDDASIKLADKGFTFGRGSVYPNYTPSPLLVAITMIGAIALFTLVANMLLPMKWHKQMVLFAFLSFISVIIYMLTSGTLITQLWALSSAVMAPVGAMIYLMDTWIYRGGQDQQSTFRSMVYAVACLALAAILAAIGGIYIGAMLGNTRFFMEFAIFRGVKLTFVLPVLLTAWAYMQRFPLWKGRTINSLEETKTFIKEFITMDVKFYIFLILGALMAVVYVFVGRSGHTAGVPVPGIEMTLRRFLENTLYARPREKEFIIGHPALMLAAFAFFRKWPMVIHFILTVAGVIGVASMVETFCHVRTPVYMTVMRGLDGWWIGLFFGIIAILLIRILTYITQWYKQGEGHHE